MVGQSGWQRRLACPLRDLALAPAGPERLDRPGGPLEAQAVRQGCPHAAPPPRRQPRRDPPRNLQRRIEGLNSRVRLISHRQLWLFSAASLIALIYLLQRQHLRPTDAIAATPMPGAPNLPSVDRRCRHRIRARCVARRDPEPRPTAPRRTDGQRGRGSLRGSEFQGRQQRPTRAVAAKFPAVHGTARAARVEQRAELHRRRRRRHAA
jgi:hypothetical protein